MDMDVNVYKFGDDGELLLFKKKMGKNDAGRKLKMTQHDDLANQITKYREYIKNHRKGVVDIFNVVSPNLKRMGISDQELELTKECVDTHDESKYNLKEFDAYRQHWNPTPTEDKNDYEFKTAWLLHIHRNPHHWQHWVVHSDDYMAPEALKMPTHYVIELMCDWAAMSLYKNSDMVFWYNQHKKNFIMHEETRQMIERMLVIFSIAINEIKKRSDSDGNNLNRA